MFRRMIFANFQVFILFGFCIHASIALNLELNEESLNLLLLRWESLLDGLRARNDMITPLRLMKSAGKNMISVYEQSCLNWSLQDYQNVRNFVLSDKYSHLLLTPRCFANLKGRLAFDETQLLQDFDNGLLGVNFQQESPVLAERLERYDPGSYLTLPDEGMRIRFNTLGIEADTLVLMNFLSPSILKQIPQSSNSTHPIDPYFEYASHIADKDPSTFYLVLSAIFALSSSYLKDPFIQEKLKLLQGKESAILNDPKLFEASEKTRLIYRSLLSAREMNGDSELTKNEIQNLHFSDRFLLKYAHMLTMVGGETSRETCRYFLGERNIERLYKSNGLLSYPRARRCLTQEEFQSNFGKWRVVSKEIIFRFHDGSIFMPPPPQLVSLMCPDTRYYRISHEDGGLVVQRSIRHLITGLNSGGEIIHFIQENEGILKLEFDLRHLNSQIPLRRNALFRLINLVLLFNVHFSNSITFDPSLVANMVKFENIFSNEKLLLFILVRYNAFFEDGVLLL